jgi:hypothetical protein
VLLVTVYVLTWHIDPYLFWLAVLVQSLLAVAFLIWGTFCILKDKETISPVREITVGLVYFGTLIVTLVAWFLLIGIRWA